MLAIGLHHALGSVGTAPPFHKLVADTLKLTALLGLLGLLKVINLPWLDALALRPSQPVARSIWRGFSVGVATLGVVVVVLLVLDVRELRTGLTLNAWIGAFIKSLIAALLVAVIEEVWFRGAVTNTLRPLGNTWALVLVALSYAIVHFIRPDRVVSAPDQWWDGYYAMSGMFARMGDAANLDAFIALFCAGLVLGWLRLREGSIYGAIACHATWVLLIKLTQRTTVTNGESDHVWLLSRYDGVIGWGLCCVFLAVALIVKMKHPQLRVPRE
jgi:uncharacterized protein